MRAPAETIRRVELPFSVFLRKTARVETVITSDIEAAAQVLRAGGLVAFPTETVYGLGAHIFNEDALRRIFEAKRRPADNPLIAHIARLEQIDELSAHVGSAGTAFVEAFFPGPLTIVLRKRPRVPLVATAGIDTIGIRMPGHPLARGFLTACDAPVAAPSANLSGRPSPTTWKAVLEDLDGRIDCILQGDATEIGLESTVVDCSSDLPFVLRLGSISLEQLREVVAETEVFAGTAATVAKSPGMRHRHYSPRAEVRLVEPGDFKLDSSDLKTAAYIGLRRPTERVKIEQVCDTVADYAHRLFEFFRECDRRDAKVVYCETVPETGIGAALMDRLRRAAEL